VSGNGTRSRHAGNGNFTINVNRNSTDSIRTGTITISAQWGAWNFAGQYVRAREVLEEAGLRSVYEGSWPW